jgi:plastocyanin
MSKTHVVEIFKTVPYYRPTNLVIEVGDKVKWINRDTTRHTATRTQAPTFDTGLLSENQESGEIQFTAASDANGFMYVCTPHPFMTAKVIVTLPGSRLESYRHESHHPADDK